MTAKQDDRYAYVIDQSYAMLEEMCGTLGISMSELIRELHAKQQLVDIRQSIVSKQRVEVPN
jgi:hypothetical protein